MKRWTLFSILFLGLLAACLSGCAFRSKFTRFKIKPLQVAASRAVLKDPRNPDVWVEYGRSCIFTNNYNGAEKAFKRALQLKPDHLSAYRHLGEVLVQQRRFKEAQQVYEKSLKKFPRDGDLWTGYGYCLIGLKKDQQALAAFKQAITLATDQVSVASARLGAAALLLRRKDTTKAQAEFDQAVKINPSILKMRD